MKNVTTLTTHSNGSALQSLPRPTLTGRNGTSRKKIWSDRALMSLPRDGYKYELFNGEIIMSPAGFNHGDICITIATALRNFARPRKLGKVCDGQTGFRLTHGLRRKTVLSPDVSFVSRKRVEAMAAPEKFFEGAPDLAVEVLSPGDALPAVEEKVRLYFLNGARLAWIVDPFEKQVYVRQPDGSVTIKLLAERLDAGEVLPGFRLPVREIFA